MHMLTCCAILWQKRVEKRGAHPNLRPPHPARPQPYPTDRVSESPHAVFQCFLIGPSAGADMYSADIEEVGPLMSLRLSREQYHGAQH